MAGKGKQNRVSTAAKKQIFLAALKKSLGIISPACEVAGITSQTVRNWRREDPEFNEAFHDIKEYQKDFVESILLKNIKKEKETSVIFYAKTQMRDRGYIEKKEVDLNMDDQTGLNSQERINRIQELRKKLMGD